jgi:UDP-2,3-diacylglucosamine pyrophosphatase LpxH
MLVILSDLHLNDGSTAAPLDPAVLDIFTERLRDLAFRASWRADGSYRPVECIDLVLLGDVLDVVRSPRWLQSELRPWNVDQPQFVDIVGSAVDDILKKNSEFFRRLRAITAEGIVSIPQGTTHGQPAFTAEELPLVVRACYMVGNADWPLHVRGPALDLIRHKVVHHLGLANLHNQPFPHEAAESPELLDILRRHRVVARHGDVFDPLHFADDRDSATLGDAILVELIGKFRASLEAELGDQLPTAVTQALAEIDNIRPVLLVPVWLEQTLERTVANAALKRAIKRLWDVAAESLLQLSFVRSRIPGGSLHFMDGLASAITFSRRESTGWATRVMRWLCELRGAASESYACHALAEPDFRNRRATHIVYGHTHAAESVPLEASYADGFVLNQMYFNTGTWRRTYRPTITVTGREEFIPAESMSYLSFFQGDERGGRTFESWTGNLGTSLAAPAAGRQPAGLRADHSRPTPLAAPHFSHATVSAGIRNSYR